MRFHYPARAMPMIWDCAHDRRGCSSARARTAGPSICCAARPQRVLLSRSAAQRCRRRCGAPISSSRRCMRSATIRWSSSRLRALRSASCWRCRATTRCPLRRGGVARLARRVVTGARTRTRRHRPALRRSRRHVAHRRDRTDEGRRAAGGDGNDGGRPEVARAGAALRRRIVSMPLLAAIFSAVGILGGYVVGVLMIGIDPGAFWSRCRAASMSGTMSATASSRASCLGWRAPSSRSTRVTRRKPTPEGVSQATTRTVVISSLAVLGLDFVLTALMFSTPR